VRGTCLGQSLWESVLKTAISIGPKSQAVAGTHIKMRLEYALHYRHVPKVDIDVFGTIHARKALGICLGSVGQRWDFPKTLLRTRGSRSKQFF
jgi:hypothetical protein